MKKFKFITAVLALVLMAGCASSMKDIKVDAESDPKVNLKGYKSYMWAASAQLIKDSQGQWVAPDMDINYEVKFLVDKQLRSKGFTEVENDPDLIVSAAIGVDMDALQIKQYPETKMDILKNAPQSALIIALSDAETGFPVWIGAATGNAQKEPQVDMVKKRLEYAVNKIFKKLPR